MILGQEHHDLNSRLGFKQLEVKQRMERLWAAVEQAQLDKFSTKDEKNLPEDLKQRSLALRHRMGEVISRMVSESGYTPDEETTLSEIRVRTMKLIEEFDGFKKG